MDGLVIVLTVPVIWLVASPPANCPILGKEAPPFRTAPTSTHQSRKSSPGAGEPSGPRSASPSANLAGQPSLRPDDCPI